MILLFLCFSAWPYKTFSKIWLLLPVTVNVITRGRCQRSCGAPTSVLQFKLMWLIGSVEEFVLM